MEQADCIFLKVIFDDALQASNRTYASILTSQKG